MRVIGREEDALTCAKRFCAFARWATSGAGEVLVMAVSDRAQRRDWCAVSAGLLSSGCRNVDVMEPRCRAADRANRISSRATI
jgi:hypothetical protein